MYRIESSGNAGRRRAGFTLVELLVVIAIIGVLIALLIPVIGVARASVQEATLTTEVASLSQSLEAFRTQYQVDYPPDFSLMTPLNAPQNDASDVKNTLNRLFRYRKADDAPLNSQGQHDESLFLNLDPAEALFFWLRGFSDNPQYPLYGRSVEERKLWLNNFPASERGKALLLEFQNVSTTPLFEFDKLRLRDDDMDGFPEYYPRFGRQMPFVYYVHTRYAQAALNPNLEVRTTISGPVQGVTLRDDIGLKNDPQLFPPRPYFRLPDVDGTPKLIPPGQLNWPFASPDKFQIICAGLDGAFGPSVDWSSVDQMSNFSYFFPVGPYISQSWPGKPHLDNITNFAEGTLEDQVP